MVSLNNNLILWRIQNPGEHLRGSFFTEIVNSFQPLTIFAKKTIVTVRLGSEYASVIIRNLHQLPSCMAKLQKLTKYLQEFLIFFLKLAPKDKFMPNESHKQAFWLVANVTNGQKRVPKYPQPWSRDSEIISSYIL